MNGEAADQIVSRRMVRDKSHVRHRCIQSDKSVGGHIVTPVRIDAELIVVDRSAIQCWFAERTTTISDALD